MRKIALMLPLILAVGCATTGTPSPQTRRIEINAEEW
jgi:hypothetical protein